MAGQVFMGLKASTADLTGGLALGLEVQQLLFVAMRNFAAQSTSHLLQGPRDRQALLRKQGASKSMATIVCSSEPKPGGGAGQSPGSSLALGWFRCGLGGGGRVMHQAREMGGRGRPLARPRCFVLGFCHLALGGGGCHLGSRSL